MCKDGKQSQTYAILKTGKYLVKGKGGNLNMWRCICLVMTQIIGE